jgi:hypothetical protein
MQVFPNGIGSISALDMQWQWLGVLVRPQHSSLFRSCQHSITSRLTTGRSADVSCPYTQYVCRQIAVPSVQRSWIRYTV